jgi:pilus assembly protein Flp/PilA
MNPFTAIVAFVYATQARLEEEKGATAVEYGLMVGLIAAVIITTVITLGGQLDDLFVKITEKLGVAAAN